MPNAKFFESRLLNTREAAYFLRLSHKTFEIWRCKRRGPRYKKIGSKVFYDENDLRAYIDAQSVETLDSVYTC